MFAGSSSGELKVVRISRSAPILALRDELRTAHRLRVIAGHERLGSPSPAAAAASKACSTSAGCRGFGFSQRTCLPACERAQRPFVVYAVRKREYDRVDRRRPRAAPHSCRARARARASTRTPRASHRRGSQQRRRRLFGRRSPARMASFIRAVESRASRTPSGRQPHLFERAPAPRLVVFAGPAR